MCFDPIGIDIILSCIKHQIEVLLINKYMEGLRYDIFVQKRYLHKNNPLSYIQMGYGNWM